MADILEQIAARVGSGQRPVSPQAMAIAEAMMRRQGGSTMPTDPNVPPYIGQNVYATEPVGGPNQYPDLIEYRGSYQPSPGMMPTDPRTEGMADPMILDRVERDMARQGDFYGTDGYYAQRSANAMQEHGPGFYDYPSERATRAIGSGTDAQPTQDYYNSLTPGMRQQFMDMKVSDPMGQSPSPDQMRERFPPGYEPLDRNKMRDALRGNYDDAQRFDDTRAVQTADLAGMSIDPNAVTSSVTNKPIQMAATYRSFIDQLNEYERLISQYGGEVMPGPARDKLITTKSALMMQLKDIYAMGAPQQGDLMMLERLIYDPTNIGANVMDWLGGPAVEDRAAASLGQLRKAIRSMVAPYMEAANIDMNELEPASRNIKDMSDEELLKMLQGGN